jgi:hypothetical protein
MTMSSYSVVVHTSKLHGLEDLALYRHSEEMCHAKRAKGREAYLRRDCTGPLPQDDGEFLDRQADCR